MCCYDINDLLDDLQFRSDDDASQSLSKSIQFTSAFNYLNGHNKNILNICKTKNRRDVPAALPPMPLDIKIELNSPPQSLHKKASFHGGKSTSFIGINDSNFNKPNRSSPNRESSTSNANMKGINALFNTQSFNKASSVPNSFSVPQNSISKSRRNQSSHSTSIKFADPNKNEFVVGVEEDALCYLGVQFKFMLHAHSDRIVYCKSTPQGILTSSADR